MSPVGMDGRSSVELPDLPQPPVRTAACTCRVSPGLSRCDEANVMLTQSTRRSSVAPHGPHRIEHDAAPPKPGEPGCRAPVEVLREHGFRLTREHTTASASAPIADAKAVRCCAAATDVMGQNRPPALQKRSADLHLKARHTAPTSIGYR
jgi:hypothetical protein